MKTALFTAAFLSIATLGIAQNRTTESANRSTADILRSIDSGVAEVNRVLGKTTTEGLAAAAIVADEALRTVEGLMPTIARISQHTQRVIGDAERTLERLSASPELKRMELQLTETAKRLEAAFEELEKADGPATK